MFSFKKSNEQAVPLFFIGEKPVYTQFKKIEADRIPPFRDSSKYLESDDFRERYGLTRKEGTQIQSAIQSNIVPESGLKKKFYAIRKDLNQRLYSEIDLRNTDKTIHWRFPENTNAWPGSQILIGSSGVGKTFRIISQIEEALKRKKKRKFIYVTPELAVDRSLKAITHNKRWQRWFQGVDVSDAAFEESGAANADDFWNKHVFPILKAAEPGTLAVLDDAPDCIIHKHLQRFLIKYLRTGRHKRIGVVSIQHNVRGGKWTSQSFSSVKFITLFPRGGGKGKQVDFLNETVGLTRKEARELVEIFAEGGRTMTIHAWSPSVIFGEKYALFV